MDYEDRFYNGDPVECVTFEAKGFVYGPLRVSYPPHSMFYIRFVEPASRTDFVRDKIAIFFIRDPRDILVSSYYSFGYTHGFSPVRQIEAQQRQAQGLIQRKTIDAYALEAADATLGRQIDLLRAYLDIIVLRMGSRLAYRIDVPAELASLPLPPMLLQPVVENAIKHGLEPKVDGGLVSIGARRQGSELILEVDDNGLGFRTTRPPGSSGLGLANLRERLANMCGGRARMEIEDRQPGTRVTIALASESIA